MNDSESADAAEPTDASERTDAAQPGDAVAPADTAGGPDRSVLALVAAAVLIVAVVASVLAFGVARPPELAPVSEQASVSVAWTEWVDDRMCVHVAAPDGTVSSLRCERDGGEIVAWTDEGIVLRVWSGRADSELVIEPASGNVLERRSASDLELHVPEGIRTYREDGLLHVELEQQRTVLWQVDAPDAYDVFSGVRSPDGEWVAMTDSAGRLLLVRADGSSDPQVWVGEIETWTMVVWEGHDYSS